MPESHEFGELDWQEICEELGKSWIHGITFTGGDPMYTQNRGQLKEVLKKIKTEFPDKKIWVYTGYTYDMISKDPTMSGCLEYIDILCDGPFVMAQKDTNLLWVGSRNQRIIDVPKSLQTGSVTLYIEL